MLSSGVFQTRYLSADLPHVDHRSQQRCAISRDAAERKKDHQSIILITIHLYHLPLPLEFEQRIVVPFP
jgi:hypothetical protein